MITVLSQASALNPGSDLWVVTSLNQSGWTPQLDWYLNFQIAKTNRHRPPELSPFLKEVGAQTGLFEIEALSQKEAPLLIQSEALLPSKWILVAPFGGQLAEWMKQISKIWLGLKKPSLRVFLPAGQNASSLTESLLTPLELKDISVVLDLTS